MKDVRKITEKYIVLHCSIMRKCFSYCRTLSVSRLQFSGRASRWAPKTQPVGVDGLAEHRADTQDESPLWLSSNRFLASFLLLKGLQDTPTSFRVTTLIQTIHPSSGTLLSGCRCHKNINYTFEILSRNNNPSLVLLLRL